MNAVKNIKRKAKGNVKAALKELLNFTNSFKKKKCQLDQNIYFGNF